MPGIDHPPSTNGSPRRARRAVTTGLALLSAVAVATMAAASAGDSGIESVDAIASSTNTSFLEGQLQLVQARAQAEATAYEAQAAAATPVQVVVPTTAPPAPTTTTPPAPTTTAAPAPAPEPVTATGGYGDPNDPASWDRLAQCEAGGNWAANTGNGYYGGLQFSLSSWQAVGGAGYPHENSRETQIEMGQRLYAQGGWSHWPGCARKLGYT